MQGSVLSNVQLQELKEIDIVIENVFSLELLAGRFVGKEEIE